MHCVSRFGARLQVGGLALLLLSAIACGSSAEPQGAVTPEDLIDSGEELEIAVPGTIWVDILNESMCDSSLKFEDFTDGQPFGTALSNDAMRETLSDADLIISDHDHASPEIRGTIADKRQDSERYIEVPIGLPTDGQKRGMDSFGANFQVNPILLTSSLDYLVEQLAAKKSRSTGLMRPCVLAYNNRLEKTGDEMIEMFASPNYKEVQIVDATDSFRSFGKHFALNVTELHPKMLLNSELTDEKATELANSVKVNAADILIVNNGMQDTVSEALAGLDVQVVGLFTNQIDAEDSELDTYDEVLVANNKRLLLALNAASGNLESSVDDN